MLGVGVTAAAARAGAGDLTGVTNTFGGGTVPGLVCGEELAEALETKPVGGSKGDTPPRPPAASIASDMRGAPVCERWCCILSRLAGKAGAELGSLSDPVDPLDSSEPEEAPRSRGEMPIGGRPSPRADSDPLFAAPLVPAPTPTPAPDVAAASAAMFGICAFG